MDVRATTRGVVSHATQVRLCDAAIERWGQSWQPWAAGEHHSPLDDVRGSRDQIANLIVLADALNFCFWSARPITATWRGRPVERYMAFAAALAAAAEEDPRWLDAAFWAEMSREQLLQALRLEGEWLMIDERVQVIRETGQVLQTSFQGRFANAAMASGGRAARLAQLLAQCFPSFRDMATCNGLEVWFLKRAQICAIDLALGWSQRGYGSLEGLDELTAFADYRVPQILRHLGIIEVESAVSDAIQSQRELPPGAPAEVELRAATIQAVERMCSVLHARGVNVTAWRLDFDLWVASHAADVRVEHHRTRTIYY